MFKISKDWLIRVSLRLLVHRKMNCVNCSWICSVQGPVFYQRAGITKSDATGHFGKPYR